MKSASKNAILHLTLFCALALLGIGNLLAHDTWLLPDRFVVAAGEPVNLALTSGMAFPQLETAIKPERVARASARCGGPEESLLAPTAVDHALRFKASCAFDGTAIIVVELKPRTLELTEKQVEEYLDEIGASSAIRDDWKNSPMPRHWREEYVKHAKTYIRVGSPRVGGVVSAVPNEFDIQPFVDPTSLRVGKRAEIGLFFKGEPVTSFPVGFVHEGETGTLVMTDEHGRAAFELTKPGKWLIRATRLHRSTKPDLDWESDFTTLTLEVR